MSQKYFAILTAYGEAKQANCMALGLPFDISTMAVGDGNGTTPVPDRLRTALVREVRRAPLNSLTRDSNNPGQIIAEQVLPDNEGGWFIREMGLYDDTGGLVAYSNAPDTYKPLLPEGSGRTQVLRMVLVVSSDSQVTLKVDPSVILATREFVSKTVADELAKLDGKQSVLYTTTGNIVLSGLGTQAGGDWPAALPDGARVLVKNQAEGSKNGIYTAAAGAWSRAADADTSIKVTPGLFVTVEQGTTLADSTWNLITDAPITLGTTPLVFERLGGKSGVAPGTFNSVTVDAQGRVVGGTNVDYVTVGNLQKGVHNTAVATGTANAISVAFTPAMVDFSPGPIWWRATAANTTTTPTLKRDGLAAATIVKGAGSPLAIGDIPGAGTWMCSQYDAATGKEVLLNPATGVTAPQPKQIMVKLNTGNGFGSTNTAIRRFLNVVTNLGSDITYTDSATLGGSFTINTSGNYAISYSDSTVGTGYCAGLSLNSANLSTPIQNLPAAEILAGGQYITSSGSNASCGWTGFLPAGSVVRAHSANTGANGTMAAVFTISRTGQ